MQIAYGHHRREALLREFPPDYEIGIVVRDFDDDAMLKIMARENMEEWGSSAIVEHETVRAVVEAYGAGLIELPAPGPMARGVRYAPSFRDDGLSSRLRDDNPYTAHAVAAFLGWTRADGRPTNKVHATLNALALIESGDLTDRDFVGLSTQQAGALVEETRRMLLAQRREAEEAQRRAAALEAERKAAAERAAKAEAEQAAALERAKAAREQADRDRAEREFRQQRERAERAERERREADARAEAMRRENARAEKARAAERTRVTSAVRDDLRSGGGYKNARKTADSVRRTSTPDGPPPDLGRTVRTLASQLASFFIDSTTARQLSLVLGYRKHFADADREQLIAGLHEMRDQIDRHLKTLDAADLPVIAVFRWNFSPLGSGGGVRWVGGVLTRARRSTGRRRPPGTATSGMWCGARCFDVTGTGAGTAGSTPELLIM